MKILHLISGGDVGGAKTHVLSLLHGLTRSDEIRLVCFMEGSFAQEARVLGIDTVVIPTKNPISAASSLAKMIKREKYEIVHCHGSRANLIGVLLRHRVKAAFITTVHSDYRLDYLGRPLHRLIYGTINTFCVRKIPYQIGVSDSMVDTLINRGFDPQNLFSIYNGVDFSSEDPPMSRRAFFAHIGMDVADDEIVFGIAARLSAVKDIGTLLRAFAVVHSRCPQTRLLIAGDGEQRKELEELASQSCAKDSYCFLGWIKDTDSFYHAIDVNMLTSLSEGFPYALPEGARMHCATISSRVGGVPYIIEHAVTGLLFEPRDVEKLTEYMILLSTNNTLRKRLADALYDRTKRDFSVEATVEKQKEIYTALLRRFHRPKNERDGVLICGAYGKGNAGDDSILEAILQQLRHIDPDLPFYVLSRNPKETQLRYRIHAIHTFGFLKFFRRMGKTKLYINGGGSLIQDATSTRSLQYYLANISLAKFRGNRVLMYGCGIGPVSEKNKTRSAKVINKYVDLITLRESNSAEELRRMGVTKPAVRVTADPALLLEPASDISIDGYMLSNELDPMGRYAMFALRPWKGFENHVDDIAASAQELHDTQGLIPLFMAFEPGRDLAACKMVQERLDCTSYVLPVPDDGHMIVGLMGRMQLLVSMRLHALIFASGLGVPLVGIVYDPKVSGFLEYLGQKCYMDLDKLQKEVLLQLIQTAMGKERVSNDVVRLRELAAMNEDAARELLT